jgi:hypothetical protein
MSFTKFKTGDLVSLRNTTGFLDWKWFYDREFFDKTIRHHDYHMLQPGTNLLILDVNAFNYDLLCVKGVLENRRLVILVRNLEKSAHLLTMPDDA